MSSSISITRTNPIISLIILSRCCLNCNSIKPTHTHCALYWHLNSGSFFIFFVFIPHLAPLISAIDLGIELAHVQHFELVNKSKFCFDIGLVFFCARDFRCGNAVEINHKKFFYDFVKLNENARNFNRQINWNS